DAIRSTRSSLRVATAQTSIRCTPTTTQSPMTERGYLLLAVIESRDRQTSRSPGTRRARQYALRNKYNCPIATRLIRICLGFGLAPAWTRCCARLHSKAKPKRQSTKSLLYPRSTSLSPLTPHFLRRLDLC